MGQIKPFLLSIIEIMIFPIFVFVSFDLNLHPDYIYVCFMFSGLVDLYNHKLRPFEFYGLVVLFCLTSYGYFFIDDFGAHPMSLSTLFLFLFFIFRGFLFVARLYCKRMYSGDISKRMYYSVVFSIVVLLAIMAPSFWSARATSNQRACYANQATLNGSLKAYSQENSTRLNLGLKEDQKKLIESGFLPEFPLCPGNADKGNLYNSDNSSVCCEFHGCIQGKK